MTTLDEQGRKQRPMHTRVCSVFDIAAQRPRGILRSLADLALRLVPMCLKIVRSAPSGALEYRGAMVRYARP